MAITEFRAGTGNVAVTEKVSRKMFAFDDPSMGWMAISSAPFDPNVK
jgi:hypothetical protein